MEVLSGDIIQLNISPPEAIGVILEEFEELKEEIKKRPERTDWLAMEREAKHLAAMCVKLIVSIREGTVENYLVKAPHD